ncbi:hypothetical protein Tco_0191507 [Tanacetum coccineum]
MLIYSYFAVISTQARPKSTVSTPAYIAPEVLSRREYYGKDQDEDDLKQKVEATARNSDVGLVDTCRIWVAFICMIASASNFHPEHLISKQEEEVVKKQNTTLYVDELRFPALVLSHSPQSERSWSYIEYWRLGTKKTLLKWQCFRMPFTALS